MNSICQKLGIDDENQSNFSGCISHFSASALALTYPADCKNKTLERAAQKNGCSIQEGKGHKLVFKNGVKITEIPNSVKDNNTYCTHVPLK